MYKKVNACVEVYKASDGSFDEQFCLLFSLSFIFYGDDFLCRYGLYDQDLKSNQLKVQNLFDRIINSHKW